MADEYLDAEFSNRSDSAGLVLRQLFQQQTFAQQTRAIRKIAVIP
ncbi:hypothetical protein [Synechococcus sp. SynAce01]|nr:hypothetical protein [Synechococcus sp. SynAce01]